MIPPISPMAIVSRSANAKGTQLWSCWRQYGFRADSYSIQKTFTGPLCLDEELQAANVSWEGHFSRDELVVGHLNPSGNTPHQMCICATLKGLKRFCVYNGVGVGWMTITIKETVVMNLRGRLSRRGRGRDDANTVLMNIFNKNFQLKVKSNSITTINLLSYWIHRVYVIMLTPVLNN